MSSAISSELELLDSLVEAAIAAGRVVHDIYRGNFQVQLKADQSPVTIADSQAEAVILARLAQVAPGVPVIAEEEVAAGRIPTLAREFFLVDPLDGTKEFVQKRGDFTVNIALIRAGAPLLGVVYAPANAMLYLGHVASQGAFRFSYSTDSREPLPQREAIKVRKAPAQGLTAVVSRSHATPETETYLTHYTVAERVSVGSSLKFCLVASGEADLYPRLGPTMEWDTAAGHAVLVAAGGRVLAAEGGALRYGKPGFRNSFFIASGAFEPQPLAARDS